MYYITRGNVCDISRNKDKRSKGGILTDVSTLSVVCERVQIGLVVTKKSGERRSREKYLSKNIFCMQRKTGPMSRL